MKKFSLGTLGVLGLGLLASAGCQTHAVTAPSLTLGAPADRHVDGLVGTLCGLTPLVGQILCTPVPSPTPSNVCLTQPYAVFAHSPQFALAFAGVGNRVVGPVHTNDCTWMIGLNELIQGKDEAGRGFLVLGINENAGTKIKTPGTQDFPGTKLTAASFGTPTFSFTSDVDLALVPSVWAAPGKLKPGVYRSTGRILLTAANVTGNVTFVSKGLTLLGAGLKLTAYSQGVLAYVDGCLGKDIELGALENTLTGQLLAYTGEVLVAGDGNVVNGSVLCNTFTMAGTANTITASPAGPCPSSTPTVLPTATPTPSPTAIPTGTPTPLPSAIATSVSPTPTPPAATPTPQPSATTAPTPAPSASSGTGTGPQPTQPAGQTNTSASFGAPFGLALDDSQNLWVTNPGNSGYVATELSNAGTVLGNGADGINAFDVAVQPGSGLIWITNEGGNNISVLNPDRSVDFVAAPCSTPEGIAFDSQGAPWVTDYTDGLVLKLDPGSGAVVDTYNVGANPRCIAFDQSGNAWITNHGAGSVSELAANGAPIGTFAVGNGPNRLAFDGSGNVWVTNGGADIPYPDGTTPGSTLTELSAAGAALGTFAVGNSPYGIAFDHAGNILVCNTGDNTVSKLSSSAAPLATYAVGREPYNILLDRGGYAWIGNFEDGTVTQLVP